MFGSQVRHLEDGSVHFYNPLIPSGTDIHTWQAIQNYQASRSQPALPLLKKGHHYQLSVAMQTTPAKSVFLKVVFTNRYGEELSQVIEKSHQARFTYPEDAYSYHVTLLSAGVREMDFQYLLLEEVGEADV